MNKLQYKTNIDFLNYKKSLWEHFFQKFSVLHTSLLLLLCCLENVKLIEMENGSYMKSNYLMKCTSTQTGNSI